MERIIIDKQELQNFLAYVEDKVEDCYYNEVHKAIEESLDNHTLAGGASHG